MLTFAHPWLALLAPLPLLVWLLLPSHVDLRRGLNAPFFDRLVALTRQTPYRAGSVAPRGYWRAAALTLVWLLVLASLVKPQWIEPPLHRDRPTRDLLLLVDLSGSMSEKDFVDSRGVKVDRLTAVKEVLRDFLPRRKGDRVGVVVFGDTPFTLVPFTTDLGLCETLLGDMEVGMAGPKTAFGDAIGLGIGLFEHSVAKSKTIIALTDGNDTGSKAPPREAAEIARDRNIVIDTIAIGDPTVVGEDKLDEPTLKAVAETTGGGFYRALDRNQLAAVYDRLDAIETHQIDSVSFRPKRDLYWIPLVAALVLSMFVQGFRMLFARPTARVGASREIEALG
jgi:Ca-activated chloride channel homolog